jgi:hypothetical protein
MRRRACGLLRKVIAGQRLALQDGGPSLDLIEPRGACRRKVESYKRVAFQPFVVLLVRIQIVEDDLEPCLWIGGDDVIREVEKFLAATAFLVCGPDLAGGNLKSGKQGRRAMPLVVVALPGQGASASTSPNDRAINGPFQRAKPWVAADREPCECAGRSPRRRSAGCRAAADLPASQGHRARNGYATS